MSVLDKIMFWKKDDPLAELEKNPLPPLDNSGLGMNHPDMMQPQQPGFGSLNEPAPQPGGMIEHDLRMDAGGLSHPSTSAYALPPTNPNYPDVHRMPQRAPEPAPQQPDSLLAKEIEIISTKLDYLKASLESINQRLSNIERLAQNDQVQQQRW